MYIQSQALHYENAMSNSDKVYHLAIAQIKDNLYNVCFAYGRRGNRLNRGIKNRVPVSLAEATAIYNDLLDQKLRKGYDYSDEIGREFFLNPQ